MKYTTNRTANGFVKTVRSKNVLKTWGENHPSHTFCYGNHRLWINNGSRHVVGISGQHGYLPRILSCYKYFLFSLNHTFHWKITSHPYARESCCAMLKLRVSGMGFQMLYIVTKPINITSTREDHATRIWTMHLLSLA